MKEGAIEFTSKTWKIQGQRIRLEKEKTVIRSVRSPDDENLIRLFALWIYYKFQDLYQIFMNRIATYSLK